jgi:hypothetical protein
MVARHFLCCLPLRLGALLISVIQLALFGLIAAGSFYTIMKSMRGRLPPYLKWVVIANASYYTVLTIAAFIGVIGTLARKARMLTTYAFYMRWSIGVQLVIDGLYLWAFFSQSRQTLIDRCVDGSTDQEVTNICEHSFDTGKWTLVIGMVVGLIIQIWAAYIVTSYARKLQEQQLWRSGPGIAPVHDHGPKYAPVRGDQESNIPLTGPYPYRDTSHSFGHPHT